MFWAKTLFNGDNTGLQTYSVAGAFEDFSADTRKAMMNQIVEFLDGVTGPDKMIEDFTICRFEQDTVPKDKIHLNIHRKPFFPAKKFMIKTEGR